MKFSLPHIDLSLQDVLNGDVFTKDWMKRQYKLLALIVVLVIVYIFEGYRAQQQMAHLVQLTKDIKDARYEYLTVSAELSEMTRQSAISVRLQAAGSPVKESVTPAVLIE